MISEGASRARPLPSPSRGGLRALSSSLRVIHGAWNAKAGRFRTISNRCLGACSARADFGEGFRPANYRCLRDTMPVEGLEEIASLLVLGALDPRAPRDPANQPPRIDS